MTAYIDTSALLRLVLREPDALDDLSSYDAPLKHTQAGFSLPIRTILKIGSTDRQVGYSPVPRFAVAVKSLSNNDLQPVKRRVSRYTVCCGRSRIDLSC